VPLARVSLFLRWQVVVRGQAPVSRLALETALPAARHHCRPPHNPDDTPRQSDRWLRRRVRRHATWADIPAYPIPGSTPSRRHFPKALAARAAYPPCTIALG